MKKVLNKIIEIILNICIIIAAFALIIVAIYSFQIHILKYDFANFLGYSAFEVVTGSMSTTIEIGDVVLVKITDDIEVDDIIVYQEGDNFITHRVTAIEGDTIITRGDSNNTEDSPTDRSAVVGKVVKILTQFATWKKVAATPSVYVPVMITILLLGIAFSYTTEEDNDEQNKEPKKSKTKNNLEESEECPKEKNQSQ